MQSRLTLSLFLLLVSSCGSEKSDHDSEARPPTSTAPAKSENKASEPASPSSKAGSMLLARVKVADLNAKSAKIEMVELQPGTKLTSGLEAARAFAEGTPLQIRGGLKGLEAANSQNTFNLNIPGFTPVQYPNQNSPYNAFYPSSSGGGINLIGGIINFIGGFVSGIINTIGGLLSALNPVKWIGGTGVGFVPTNPYQYGGYQYFPYGQTPP